MKRALAVAAVTVGLLGGGMIAATPSQAATPKAWMTKYEFRWIDITPKYGDTLKETRRWVEGKGSLGYASSWYEDMYCKRYNSSYTTCLEYAGGVTHTYRIYYWRTSWRAKYGAAVTFEDGHATAKSYYR